MDVSKRIWFSTRTLLLIGAISAVTANAYADARRDLYFQEAARRYFDLPQNARTFAMGSSSIETSSDSSSVIGNPAGLGFMTGGDASLGYGWNRISGNEHPSYREVLDHEDSGSALIAAPIVPVAGDLPRYGNAGFGWTGYQSDWDHDSFNTHTDGVRIHGAYAKAINPTLSFGYSLSWVEDALESDILKYNMSNGFRHTIGGQARMSESLTLGSTFFWGYGDRDVRFAGINGKTTSDVREIGYSLGLAWKFLPHTWLTSSLDYENYDANGDIVVAPAQDWVGGDEHGDAFGAHLGVEHQLNDWIALRAGYRYQGNQSYYFDREELAALNGSAKYNAWSAGIGLTWPINSDYIKAVKLDYGAEYRSVGHKDWEHLVTVSVPFDLCRGSV